MSRADTFTDVWDRLLDAFPQSATRPGTSAMYAELLADIPDDELQSTVTDGIATAWHFTRMPTIAEIRQHWTHLRVRTLGVALPEEAWGEVMAQIRKCGQYRRPKFTSDLIVQAVKAVGGWMLLTEMQSMDEVAPNRARFIDAYTGILERAKHTATMTPDVRAGVLGADPAGAFLKQLTAPDALQAPAGRMPHLVYRQATPDEIARGDFVHFDPEVA